MHSTRKPCKPPDAMSEPTQDHEALLERAIEAARAVFEDKSVEQDVTRGSLEILIDEIQMLLDTLN